MATIDLLDLDRFQRGEHHAMFEHLRAENPVSWHPHPTASTGGFWNLVLHEHVTQANRDATRFSSELGGITIPDPGEFGQSDAVAMDPRGSMLVSTDPPKHTRYRQLISKGFTPRTVATLEDHIRARATRIIDSVIERGRCDFVEDIAAELPVQALAELMGFPQGDRRMLFDWSNRLMGADDPEFMATNADIGSAAAELFIYVSELAAARRDDPRNDLVTALINAEIDGDRLTEEEFNMFMILLTVAGNETTRNTTSWGMLALMQHPEQYEALRDDPGLRPGAIEEILRWASPVLHFRRTATVDLEIGGRQMAAGDRVVLWYVSANRDESVFDDPFTFDITRSPNDHVAFGGGGPHYCLGASLARLQLRCIFDEILDRIPDMRPTGPPEILRSNLIGGIKHLPVAYETRPRRQSGGPSAVDR